MGATRLRRHVEDICSVSTFIDPSEWDVDHLKGKLEDYLAYSRQRLDVVVSKFEELGYSAELQDFTFYGRTATNAVFRRRGVRKGRKGLWLAAHHDYCAGLGAEDDATGLAVMLELARQFRDSPAAEHLVFASFDLEERGMVGASRYVSSLSEEDLKGIDALVTLECLGSGKDFTVCESLKEKECDRELNARLMACVGSLGYRLLSDRYDFGSDAIPFSNRGVRATDFCSLTYSAYKAYRKRKGTWGDVTVTHTARDMPENIDYCHLADAGRILAGFIRREYCGDSF